MVSTVAKMIKRALLPRKNTLTGTIDLSLGIDILHVERVMRESVLMKESGGKGTMQNQSTMTLDIEALQDIAIDIVAGVRQDTVIEIPKWIGNEKDITKRNTTEKDMKIDVNLSEGGRSMREDTVPIEITGVTVVAAVTVTTEDTIDLRAGEHIHHPGNHILVVETMMSCHV